MDQYKIISESELRRACVEDPLGVRRLLLSPFLAGLMEWIIKRGHITTKELSGRSAIGIQNASTQLKKLHSLGYLERKRITSESGGIEYIYRSAI